MPKLTVKNANDVPPARKTSRVILESQLEYEGYIYAIGSDVGELELTPSEQPRSVKVRLRRAATRLGKDIETWDTNDRVYFRLMNKRGRPRKS